jgi:hypothetical protein
MALQYPPERRPPWLNERGELLIGKLPLDSTLTQAISGVIRSAGFWIAAMTATRGT